MLSSIRDLVAHRDSLARALASERARRVDTEERLGAAYRQIQGMHEANAKLACRLMGHDPETEHDHV